MQLKDRIAIVTGAGRGIGKTIALGLAREGAAIVINYHGSEESAEELRNEIEGMGGRALKFRADVAKCKEVQAMVNATLTTFGKVDILINNAAVKTRLLVADTSEERWDWIIDTNLKGTFLCSQAVLKPMMERRNGKIVNIASSIGLNGQASGAAYAASKGGVIGFTKSLALEVAPYEINVNAIAPGRMNTDQWREGRSKDEIEELLRVPRLLSKGVCLPEDIVGTVLYLVTDASKYVTGQLILMRAP